MSTLTIAVRTGDSEESQTVDAGTRVWQLFADDPSVIAARIDGDLVDLARELNDGETVEPVPMDSSDGLNILRHSTAR